MSSVGWLAQFIPGARESIVCRKDGTLRMAEPRQDKRHICVLILSLFPPLPPFFVVMQDVHHMSYVCAFVLVLCCPLMYKAQID